MATRFDFGTAVGILAAFVLSFASVTATAAPLVARVDLKAQRMEVFVEGQRRFSWPVSTGRKGWETQPGAYTPYKMLPYYFSKQWNMELPYLIWIGDDGTAIHGTTQGNRLGRPASHGCIRLSIPNARAFYKLVERYGMWSTRIDVIR
ncbi:MAG: L,D-transpeptidase [Hyphomicrobiaceae bacterium]